MHNTRKAFIRFAFKLFRAVAKTLGRKSSRRKGRGCKCAPSCLTADGNADRIRVSRASAVADRWGCKSVRIPAVGVVTARNYGYYREKHGVTIGVAPIKIEM